MLCRDAGANRPLFDLPPGRELLRTFEPDGTQAQFGVIAELAADDQAVIVHAIDPMAGVGAASAPTAPARLTSHLVAARTTGASVVLVPPTR